VSAFIGANRQDFQDRPATAEGVVPSLRECDRSDESAGNKESNPSQKHIQALDAVMKRAIFLAQARTKRNISYQAL